MDQVRLNVDTNLIIAAIDGEIGQLEKARALLSGMDSAASADQEETPAKRPAKRRRRLSPEARKRIAEAQKKRWAAVKAAKAAKGPRAAKKVKKEASAKKAAIKKPAVKKPARKVQARKAAVAKKTKKAASVPAQAAGAEVSAS